MGTSPTGTSKQYAQLIAKADLIYFGGGYPHVAMRVLPGTRVMAAFACSRGSGWRAAFWQTMKS
jgi:hypothetical protein